MISYDGAAQKRTTSGVYFYTTSDILFMIRIQNIYMIRIQENKMKFQLFNKKKTVQVASQEIVKPCNSCFVNRPELGHTIPLAPIDYTCAPFGKFGLTFVYENDTIDLKLLKRALSCTLAEYPYLAGHIAVDLGEQGREKLNFVYSYRGIEWTDKLCKNMSISDVISVVFSDPKNARRMKSCFAAPDMTPFEPEERDAVKLWKKSDYLMQVCASKFDDGLILTVSVSHLAIDVSPLGALLDAWSKNYATLSQRGDCSISRDLKANVSTVQEHMFQKARELLKEGFSYTYDADKDLYQIVDTRKTFERLPILLKILNKLLPRPDWTIMYAKCSKLNMLKEQLLGEVKAVHPNITRLSDNDIMVACLWKALAKSLKNSSQKKQLTISVDMRGRYDPPMPKPSWGNCSCVIPVAAVTQEDGHVSLAELAVRVRNIIGDLNADKFQADATRATQILDSSANIPSVEWSPRVLKLAFTDMVIPMSIPNWFFSKEWNEATFGENTPVWVQPMGMKGLVAVIIPSVPGPDGPGYLINLQQSIKEIHIDESFELF